MKTIRFIRLAAFSLLCCIHFNFAIAQGFGEIRGIIKNTSLEPVPFATVRILQGNLLIGGSQTDIEGRYHVKPLSPGMYEMIVTEAGHQTSIINKIKVVPNEATYVDLKMNINTLGTITVTAKAIDYTKSGADRSMYSMVSLDSKELMQSASYSAGDVNAAVEAMTSDVVNTGDGQMHFRGSRGDANGYFVDGVRTLGTARIPGLAIDNLTVFSGGVPAMYGDLTAGMVLITTKSYFTGIRDKNMFNARMREQREEEETRQKELEEEEKRKAEIEKEKSENK
jgi:hypothetical protein